jgi:glycosyltransferase involved in cell wall biosynthesis
VHWEPNPEAPFLLDLSSLAHAVRRDGLSTREIFDYVMEFEPDGVFISGWMDRKYMRAAAGFKRRGIPVILGLDTQWTGSLKQRIGCATAPLWLHPSVSAIWAPGERQAHLAGHLGYRGSNCWYGVYCCDLRIFTTRGAEHESREGSFLFVGRYVEEKGISDLMEAYRLYRQQSAAPWPLYCVGNGSLRDAITGVPGAVDLGFVEPHSLPAIMRRHGGAFILPSRIEPWGVVLQEAAACGCPLISSDVCGAGVHLLQDGYNGLRFTAGRPAELAKCMLQMASLPEARRAEMGRASVALSGQFTPQRWAKTIVEGIARAAPAGAVATPQ